MCKDNFLSEFERLETIAVATKPLFGSLVELGCEDPERTCVIANAVWPESVICCPTWDSTFENGIEEDSKPTDQIQRQANQFVKQVSAVARGNLTIISCEDLVIHLLKLSPVKFCHVNASLDLEFSKRFIRLMLPLLHAHGTLVGHYLDTPHSDVHAASQHLQPIEVGDDQSDSTIPRMWHWWNGDPNTIVL